MPIRTLKEDILPITKKLAAEFSEMKASTGECAFDATHMENLAVLMETGPYHAPIWASVFCKEDGNTYRGDGKHTAALFHTGRLFMGGRDAHVIRAECDKCSEVGDFYNQFNQPETSRSKTEINMSISSQIPAIAKFTKGFINSVVSGIDMSLRGGPSKEKGGKVSLLEKAKRMRGEVPFIMFLASIHDSPGVVAIIQHIKTVPVVAFCHAIYHENAALAREFLTLVRDGSNPNHADPDRALYEYLRTCKLGVSKKKDKEIASEIDVLRRCHKGWEDYKARKNGASAKGSPKPRHKGRGRRSKALAAA